VVVAATIHAAGLFSSSAIAVNAEQSRRSIGSSDPILQRSHS
jgi:hypothetical protein